MREDSHLEDMRSAIRGDFERLAERRGGQELMRSPPKESDVSPPEETDGVESELMPAPEPIAEAEEPGEREESEREGPRDVREAEESVEAAETEQLSATERTKPAELPGTSPDEPRPRSWLDRLLGR